MKAIVYEKYGQPDVLSLAEIDKPAVKEEELLVQVHAATVTPFDWHMLTGSPPLARLFAGLFKPKNRVLGTDIAGRVAAVGPGVQRFQIGDELFGGRSSGGYAQFATAPEAALYHKPAGLSFAEAAALQFSAFGALIGLSQLGRLRAGQAVLINGASGGIGTLALPIARTFPLHQVPDAFRHYLQGHILGRIVITVA